MWTVCKPELCIANISTCSTLLRVLFSEVNSLPLAPVCFIPLVPRLFHNPKACSRLSNLIFNITALLYLLALLPHLPCSRMVLLTLAGGNQSPGLQGFLSPMCQLLFTQACGLRIDHRIHNPLPLCWKISLGQLLFHSWLISSWLSEIDVEECESESKMDAHTSLRTDYLYPCVNQTLWAPFKPIDVNYVSGSFKEGDVFGISTPQF